MYVVLLLILPLELAPLFLEVIHSLSLHLWGTNYK